MWDRAAARGGLVLALGCLAGCGRSGDPAVLADATADPAATTLHEPAAPGDAAARPPPSSAAPPAAPLDASPPAAPALAATERRSAPVAGASAHRPAAPSAPPAAPHPLEAWMRGPATAAFRSGDLESIASTLEQMARWAPPGYANWTSIAEDGSAAARIGSLEGVKAACRGCHGQYRNDYRAHLATRPLS